MNQIETAWADITGTAASGRTALELADFVSVKQYGAVGDGTTDDTTAFQNALNASKSVYVPPGNYVCDSLTFALDGTLLFGSGPGSIITFKAAETGTLLTTGARAVTIRDLTLFGGLTSTLNATASSPADRSALSIATQKNSFLSNVTIHGFGKYGLLASDASRDKLAHLRTVGLTVYNTWSAVYLGSTAEYITFTGCDVSDCWWAWTITAGNVSLSNCKINTCRVGVYLYKNGNSNNSHGNITGCLINHCTIAIWAEEVEYGFNFTGCCVFEGELLLDRCTGVNITGGILDPSVMRFRGGNRNYVRDNYLPGDYLTTITHDYQSVADDTVLIDNYYDDGTFEESSSQGQSAEIELQPTGTTQAIDWPSGLHQSLNLHEATGAMTLTFTAPAYVGVLTLILEQGDTARDITWPAAVKWLGTEPTWSSENNTARVIRFRYDGTNYYAEPSGTTTYTEPAGEGAISDTPSTITDLGLWLRGDTNVKLSGVAVTNGQAIDSWLTCEGNAHDFVQATAGKRPTWVSSGINGQGSVSFDGGDILIRAANTLATNEGTLFVVFRAASFTDYACVFSQATGSAGPYLAAYARYTAALPNAAIDNLSDAVRGSTTIGTAANYCVKWQSNGSTTSIEVNGVDETEAAPVGSNAGSWFADFATTKTCIGGVAYSSDLFFFNGQIAEIICYDRLLTGGELTTLETYLNGRYGITFA